MMYIFIFRMDNRMLTRWTKEKMYLAIKTTLHQKRWDREAVFLKIL